MPDITFRAAVTAIAILGLLILVLALHGRHRPHEDTDRLPSVPVPAGTSMAK